MGANGGGVVKGACPPPNLAPNNFQEKSSGVSRMQENPGLPTKKANSVPALLPASLPQTL